MHRAEARRGGASGLRVGGWTALGRSERRGRPAGSGLPRGELVWVGTWGGRVGQELGWMGMGWGHRWLTSTWVIQYVLAEGGGGGGEAAVRGWGSAHVAQERLVDADEKMVTQ